jgi:alkanesulfonate monooxygenase
MPVEFIGALLTNDVSETRSAEAPIDRRFFRRIVRAHEDAGFDRALVALASTMPEPMQVAADAVAHSERLGFLIAHRPGFKAPTVVAREYATLDQFSEGRVALHTISGGVDAEQWRDGDFVEKPERYARSEEFLQVLKRAWTATEPFDHDGRFYRLRDALFPVRPYQGPRIPLFFGGSSDVAHRIAGAEADVFATFAQPLDQIAEEIAAVAAAAAAAGRADAPRTSVSFRPILGATEELAWARAERILEGTKAAQRAHGGVQAQAFRGAAVEPSVGFQRQLRAAERGERQGALWTALASATGVGGNSTALVGTPETVAEALLEYVDLGVSTLLIRGYDPLDDAIDYGRDLIPLLRAGVAQRDRERAAAGRPLIGAGEVGGAGWREDAGLIPRSVEPAGAPAGAVA